MINLTIDGVEVEAKEGTSIWETARDYAIDIPTLCNHEELTPYGACGLCIVEIEENGTSKVEHSCLYPVKKGLVVKTDTEKIINHRKMLLELLMARCPTSNVAKKLALGMGIEKTMFEVDEGKCLLCGLCERVCREVVEVNAIGFASKGIEKEVVTPFMKPSEECIGCGLCAYVCPGEFIKLEDIGDIRRIENWKVEFKLRKCPKCGNYFAPDTQLEHLRKRFGLPENAMQNCQKCEDWSTYLTQMINFK